jgi:hypothetical protein
MGHTHWLTLSDALVKDKTQKVEIKSKLRDRGALADGLAQS